MPCKPMPFLRTIFAFTAALSRRMRWWGMAATLVATWSLVGCSTLRQVESTVQSYSTTTTLPQPSTFRIERLPSQEHDSQFAAIARMTCTALQQVGLRPDDTQAALVVTIHTQASYITPDGPNPYPWAIGDFGRYGSFYGHRHSRITARALLRDDPPRLYRRGIALLIRDTHNQKVVYETSAVHEDIWTQDPEIYGVLAHAALQGFPQAPTGKRIVVLPLHHFKDGMPTNHTPAAPAAPPPLTPAPLANNLARGC